MLPTLALTLLTVLPLAACAPTHPLEGSLTSLLDLSYERAEAQSVENEVSIRFLEARGAGEDTILKISARLEGVSLSPRVPIDLAQRLGDETTPQRGTVSRNVLDEPPRDFPPIARGALTFHGYLDAGKTVTGELHVTFTNGTDAYSGRTLFGRFEATVP